MGNKYETLLQNSHMGGSSFIVEDSRMLKWKKLMHIRYFVHLGKREDISVNYKVATDNEGVVIEERYKVPTTGKDKISLSITIYSNTGRVLIQGNNKKEWINNEFEKLKKIIDKSKIEDISKQYVKEFELLESDVGEEDVDAEDEICKMATDLVYDVMQCIIDEESQQDKEMTKILKSKCKSTPKNIDEKKSRVDCIQIKNNQKAIENLESMMIELQESYELRMNEFYVNVRNMEDCHTKDLVEMKKENERLSIAVKEKDIIMKN